MIKISQVASSVKSIAQKGAGKIQQSKMSNKIDNLLRVADIARNMNELGKERSIAIYAKNYALFLNSSFRKGFQSVFKK